MKRAKRKLKNETAKYFCTACCRYDCKFNKRAIKRHKKGCELYKKGKRNSELACKRYKLKSKHQK